jgi:hypothetical protein
MSGTENNAPAPKRSNRRWFVWLLLGVLGGAALHYYEPRVYRALMEDVVEMMRRDINVMIPRPLREDADVNSFSVAFESHDARTAMRITERLSSLFVEENVEDRALLADQTDQFLKGELEELRRRLIATEAGLAEKGRGAVPSWQTAEHEVLVAIFKQLLEKSEAAKMAVNLERRQLGEQFKIIDGARLPERPISPRLFPYLALGALAGLAAGMVSSLASFVWRQRRPRPATA